MENKETRPRTQKNRHKIFFYSLASTLYVGRLWKRNEASSVCNRSSTRTRPDSRKNVWATHVRRIMRKNWTLKWCQTSHSNVSHPFVLLQSYTVEGYPSRTSNCNTSKPRVRWKIPANMLATGRFTGKAWQRKRNFSYFQSPSHENTLTHSLYLVKWSCCVTSTITALPFAICHCNLSSCRRGRGGRGGGEVNDTDAKLHCAKFKSGKLPQEKLENVNAVLCCTGSGGCGCNSYWQDLSTPIIHCLLKCGNLFFISREPVRNRKFMLSQKEN